MKKKTLLILAVLIAALACLFTSCSASVEPPKAEEEFGYVTFGNGGSRSLTTLYGIKNYDDLYWYYTAEKKDGFGLTGQTDGKTAVPPKTGDGKGIGSGTIRLSQGAWQFELFAYEGRNDDLTGNNLVYKGTSDIIVLKGGETKAVPVSVNLQGATGVVNFSQAYFEWANNSAAVGSIYVTVELAKDGSTPTTYFFGPLTRSNDKYTFATTTYTETVPEGYYTCTVNAYMEEDVTVAASGKSVKTGATPLATQTLGLRVYGNATTYITDNLTEGIFAKVVFDVAEQDMKVFVPNTDGSASITGISVTPSGDTTKTTSVEFSENALSGLAKDVTLQLDVKVTPVEAANEKFNITGVDSSNKSAFAGIDITLMQTTSDGQTSPVNSFNDNSSTTARVTTYIAKGLSNVQVKYSGNPDETITSTYNPDDGCLSFTTYHFSEYYILAETVAVNVNKNIAYNDLEKAVKDANDGDIIKLYKDVTLNKVLEIGKSIIIYGNDRKIKNSANRVISITEPDISVELYNLGVISTCTADSDVRGISFWDGTDNSSLLLDGCTVSASFYAINIIPGSSNLNITIKNGTVAAGWAAINSFSNNSTFTIENSTLKGLNDKGESTWNDYATIVFDGNGLWYQNNIGTYGSGNTMTISNSTIFASSDSSNNQAWMAIQYGAMNNDIILSNTTVKDDNNENQINNISICPFVGYSKGYYSKSYDLHSTLSVDGDVTKICYHGDNDDGIVTGEHLPYSECEDVARIGSQYYTTLESAVKDSKDGDIIDLLKDVTLSGPITITKNITLEGNGEYTISGYPIWISSAEGDRAVKFYKVNFASPDNEKHNASSVYASLLKGKVSFDDCTFTNPQWECIQITPMDGAEIIVGNCTFIADGNRTYAHGNKVERLLHIQNTKASGDYKTTIADNEFIGVDLCRNAVIDVDDIAAFGNVICGGNTFANHDGTPVSTLADGMIYVNINGKYDAANVATNTYAQFTQTPEAALQH